MIIQIYDVEFIKIPTQWIFKVFEEALMGTEIYQDMRKSFLKSFVEKKKSLTFVS